MLMVLVFFIIGGGLQMTLALDNGLALTPPMGWLSWERFRCVTDCGKYPDSCVSEKLYMAMADRMVADGYKDAGYEYVHIDDCWSAKTRDSDGSLRPDPQRFPSGMKALADYMHSKGLKLGIYTDIGYATCQKYPGSEFYMQRDANTFAGWGIDLVKTDACNAELDEMHISYPTFGFYLNQTGRPMLYSCEWVAAQVTHSMKVDYASVRKTCNTWRNYVDVQDSWDKVKDILRFYGANAQNFANFSGPGGFSDPDQLLAGDFGLSIYQQKAQFGMWAMLASPLLMSVDLRTITPEAKDILLNRHVIAINQDPMGAQGLMLYGISDSISVWLRPLSTPKGSYAIAFLNEDDQGRSMDFSIHLVDIGLTSANGYNVTDVFYNKAMGQYKPTSSLEVLIEPTCIVLVKATPL